MKRHQAFTFFYRPRGEGNVFTGMGHSFCPRGWRGCIPACTWAVEGRKAGSLHPSPPTRDGHWRGRYAFYWNAYLFRLNFSFHTNCSFYCQEYFQCSFKRCTSQIKAVAMIIFFWHCPLEELWRHDIWNAVNNSPSMIITDSHLKSKKYSTVEQPSISFNGRPSPSECKDDGTFFSSWRLLEDVAQTFLPNLQPMWYSPFRIMAHFHQWRRIRISGTEIRP